MWKSGLASGIVIRSGRWKENEKITGVGFRASDIRLRVRFYIMRNGWDRKRATKFWNWNIAGMPEHPFDNLKETAKTVCACAEAWAEHVVGKNMIKLRLFQKV